jgi:hypothetical protein
MAKMLGARKTAILEARDEEGNVVEEYRALFTTRALADAEARIGQSMSTVIMGFVSGKSGVRELSLLLQAGMEAERRASGGHGEPVTYDEACDVLDMVGLTPAAETLGNAVTAVLSYGQKKDKADSGSEPEKN